MLLARVLETFIQVGRLSVIDANGKTHVFGGDTAPAVTIRLHSRSLHWRMALTPELTAGEAYMDGTLTVEDGSLYDFLDLMGRNMRLRATKAIKGPFGEVNRLFRRLQQYNPAKRARHNVAHHYDLSDELYALFLDRDLNYSCAYFRAPDDDLETAQRQKQRHIAAKLAIAPGMKVLDIGCGWGSMSLYLARRLETQVTGITLSDNQAILAQARAREVGLDDRVNFELRDYREQTGTFDRIVSIGMFEHVGVNHYKTYFDVVRDRLADDGVALLHTIGRYTAPGATNPWLKKYIFPGGYVPALSEVVTAIERSGLWINDIEVWRLHYAQTVRHWRHRLYANWDKVAKLYDERFCRMWEFYLAGAEISFRYRSTCVFQIQLSKHRETLPITRDYMMEAEEALTAAEKAAPDDRLRVASVAGGQS